jgi:hypothetical protein
MAFGQNSGPAASRRQVQELLELLEDAGHSGFRDARGPMGFTQRQANGKFTTDEADGFIAQLLDAQHRGNTDTDTRAEASEPADEAAATSALDRVKPSPKLTAADRAIRRLSDEELATELQRRGWIVMEP